MKTEMKKLFLVSAIAAATLSMTACGGGGGSDKKNTDPVTGGPAGGGNGSVDGTVRIQKTGKAVPKEEAKMGRASGIWFHRYELFEDGIPVDSEASGEVKHYGSQVRSVQYVNDNELIIDACSLEAPQTVTLEAFTTSLVEDSKIEEDDPLDLPCDGEIDYQFYERSDTDYRVDLVCDGELIGMSEMKQISTQPQYNNGSLSFRADSGESLTTTGGVCGLLFHATVEDANSSFEHIGLVEVVAPYEDTKLKMTMITFDGLKEGTYQILGPNNPGGQSAMVVLETPAASAGGQTPGGDDDESEGGDLFASGHDTDDDFDDIGDGIGDDFDDIDDDFDDIGDDFDEGDIDDIGDDDSGNTDGGLKIMPTGGTITIESLDGFSASGSFDLIQPDESRIQGNFSLDLQ